MTNRNERPTPEALAAWRSYLESHVRLMTRLDRDLRDRHGIGIEWYDVLVQLHEAGGQRTMSDLARALVVSPSNCTRRVTRMTEAGLVERQRDTDDARVVHAILTTAGRAALRRAATTHLRGVHRHFSRFLGPDQASELTSLFGHVTTSLDDNGAAAPDVDADASGPGPG